MFFRRLSRDPKPQREGMDGTTGVGIGRGLPSHAAALHMMLQLPRFVPDLEFYFLYAMLALCRIVLDCVLLAPVRMGRSMVTWAARPSMAAFRGCAVHAYTLCLVASGVAALALSPLSPAYATSMPTSGAYADAYHFIRAGSSLKLLLLFRLLEVADRVVSAMAIDGVTAAEAAVGAAVAPSEATVTQARKTFGAAVTAVVLIISSCVMVALHTWVLLLYTVGVNVALNSSSVNGIIAIASATNVNEIRSVMYKRHNQDALFQFLCGDAVERFHLTVVVLVIIVQHLRDGGLGAVDPHMLFYVFAVESLTDIVKYTIVSKLNRIPLSTYVQYAQVWMVDIAASTFLPHLMHLPFVDELDHRLHSIGSSSHSALPPTQRTVVQQALVHADDSTPRSALLNPSRRAGFVPFSYAALIVWSLAQYSWLSDVEGKEASLRPKSMDVTLGTLFLLVTAAFFFRTVMASVLVGMAARFVDREVVIRYKRKEAVKAEGHSPQIGLLLSASRGKDGDVPCPIRRRGDTGRRQTVIAAITEKDVEPPPYALSLSDNVARLLQVERFQL